MSQRKKVKVLVFGNPILKNDCLPLKLVLELGRLFPEIEFKEFDPNENLDNEGRNLNIIDTIEGAKRVVLITEVDSISLPKRYSMHDFDLGYNLKLLKKLDYLDSVKIFGVPMKITKAKALKELSALISSSLL